MRHKDMHRRARLGMDMAFYHSSRITRFHPWVSIWYVG